MRRLKLVKSGTAEPKPKPHVKPKRPVIEVPIYMTAMRGGLADKDGYKHFRMVVGPAGGYGHGLPYAMGNIAVNTAESAGAAVVRFVVKVNPFHK
jgi:hypothetical protein